MAEPKAGRVLLYTPRVKQISYPRYYRTSYRSWNRKDSFNRTQQVLPTKENNVKSDKIKLKNFTKIL